MRNHSCALVITSEYIAPGVAAHHHARHRDRPWSSVSPSELWNLDLTWTFGKADGPIVLRRGAPPCLHPRKKIWDSPAGDRVSRYALLWREIVAAPDSLAIPSQPAWADVDSREGF